MVEEARAVQTMLDLGISQTAIGKATGRSRSYVRNAQVAATVDEALSVAADGYALMLDQLADLAEFTDDEDAASRLLDSAYEPGEWAHTPWPTSASSGKPPPRSPWLAKNSPAPV